MIVHASPHLIFFAVNDLYALSDPRGWKNTETVVVGSSSSQGSQVNNLLFLTF